MGGVGLADAVVAIALVALVVVDGSAWGLALRVLVVGPSNAPGARLAGGLAIAAPVVGWCAVSGTGICVCTARVVGSVPRRVCVRRWLSLVARAGGPWAIG